MTFREAIFVQEAAPVGPGDLGTPGGGEHLILAAPTDSYARWVRRNRSY